jgi:hypothetical protein
VRMKPWESSSSVSAKQSVCGFTPMNTNIADIGLSVRAPVATVFTTTDSNDWLPRTLSTSTPLRTSMLAVARIRSTRYCDIMGTRSGALTSMVTVRAYREKNSAPWPAEFAPPTTHTSLPRYRAASVMAAP